MLKRLYTLFIIIAVTASSTIKAEDTVYPTLTTQGGTYELVTSEEQIVDGGVYLIAGIEKNHLQLMSTIFENAAGTLRRFSAVEMSNSDLTPTIKVDNVNSAAYPYEYVFKKKTEGNFEFKLVDINKKCIKNVSPANAGNNYLNIDLVSEEETADVFFAISLQDKQTDKWMFSNTNVNGQKVCLGSAQSTSSSKEAYFTCMKAPTLYYVALYKKVTSSPNTASFSMSNVGYATLYYGDKDVTLPAGLTASTYTLKNTQDATYLTPSHTYIAGDKIPAGIAVVVKGNEGNYTLTLSEKDDNLTKYSNVLEGCDEETALTADPNKYFYKLTLNSAEDPNSVGFYWGADNGAAFTTLAHKAYLAISKSAAAKSIVTFRDSDSQNTTGLVDVKANEKAEVIYELSGKRVSVSHKGIQIKKGKKYLVK